MALAGMMPFRRSVLVLCLGSKTEMEKGVIPFRRRVFFLGPEIEICNEIVKEKKIILGLA